MGLRDKFCRLQCFRIYRKLFYAGIQNDFFEKVVRVILKSVSLSICFRNILMETERLEPSRSDPAYLEPILGLKNTFTNFDKTLKRLEHSSRQTADDILLAG